MATLKFTIRCNSVPVTIENGDGKSEDYELREMDAASRDRYLDSLSLRIKLDTAGKPTGVTKFEGMQAELLVHCLRKKDGSPVRKEVIQSWPASVVSGLFTEAQQINLLNQEAKEVAAASKND